MPANQLPALPFAGPGIPGGYRVGSKVPIDVRLVYHTKEQRNAEQQTYPGMVVAVLGPKVMSGNTPTYPDSEVFVLTADREPNYGGPTTLDSDWVQLTGVTVGGSSYKGPVSVDPDGNFYPDLEDAALRASLTPGDYYRVEETETNNYSLDGYDGRNAGTRLASNDTLIWEGTRFTRFQNTNPNLALYTDQQGAKFLGDVQQIIRDMNVRQYQPGVDFKRGDVMYYADDDGTSTFLALRDLGAAEAASFIGQAAIGRWLMLSTTNPDLMPGMPVSGDHIGRAATGSFAPSRRSYNFLTPEEVDARIAQYGGGVYKPIIGGKARTFATANVNELPAN
jgi:hypothetical protein